MTGDAFCGNGHEFTDDGTHFTPSGHRRSQGGPASAVLYKRRREQARAASAYLMAQFAALLGTPADDWQELALCAETDPETFFPEKGGSTREAKRICQGCEVRAECLEYALGHRERFGIWGGLSERERRRLTAGGEVAA